MSQTEPNPSTAPDMGLIRKRILARRDELGVTNYWIGKRADGSMQGVYNFLQGKTDTSFRTLESILELMGLQITEIEDFKKAE